LLYKQENSICPQAKWENTLSYSAKKGL
jgi:hypothetical protein